MEHQEWEHQEAGAKCAEILRTCLYANIATCDNNEPWNTPVTAIPDTDLNLYWSSWILAVHSRNVVANPRVFITFYDSTRARGTNNMRCLYLRCEAAVVSDPGEARKAHELIYPTERVDLTEFSDPGPKRFYRARPLEAWLNILSERELQPTTIKMRLEVPLDSIRLAAELPSLP
jgi:nitroimidazol reductase NimA-like FMN-containing flavoprotein (pyridoxamine 5'-phosphate oxidase superfamily)